MLTKEQNDRLTLVGPGAPMGELMRRYWHPVAFTPQLDREPVRRVRLLGEDLVLYRDRGGRLGLVGPLCAHRRASLAFGIVEEEGLRCPYHGWRYNQEGQCIEQPAEDVEDFDETFIKSVKLTAYPVQELGGVIFAYLGPEPVPLIPRWEPFVKPRVLRSIGAVMIPCNWLQCMENSLDQTHVEWLHGRFDNYVVERQGKLEWQRKLRHHAKIGWDIFEHGITKRRVMVGGTENDPEWRLGHPILFPNILANSSSGFQIRVPIDDTHTWHVYYTTRDLPEGVEDADRPPILYPVPLPGFNAEDLPTWDLLDNNSGQDMLMWYTQGGIADRREERLGNSDKGVVLYRNLLEVNMLKVQRGEDPMNTFRDPETNECIHTVSERDDGPIASYFYEGPQPVGRGNTGASGKYNPLSQAIEELIGAKR